MTATQKCCTKCGQMKPTSEFGAARKRKDGLQPWCRPCNREYHQGYQDTKRESIRDRRLSYCHGITPEQYEALLARQGGRCAGCGTTMCKTGRAFATDHDHACCPPNGGRNTTYGACGKCVRGLVCLACNLRDVLAGQPHVDWSEVLAQVTA